MTAVVMAKPGTPLAPSVAANPAEVPAELALRVRGLSGADPVGFLCQLALCWATIAAAVGAAIVTDSAWLTALALPIVATRQFTLGFLLHEEVHRLGVRRPYGAWLTNLLAAYPIGLSVESYGPVHLAHHRHFFTERDPDYVRKQGPAWTFPQPGWRVALHLLHDAVGLGLPYQARAKRASLQRVRPSSRPDTPRWLQPAFYAAVAAVAWSTGTWQSVLLYWVLPWATLLQLMVRLGATTEHKYDLVEPTVAEATPMLLLRWWERLIQPTLGFFTYHVYHHHYPGVPCSRLRRVHEAFEAAGLVSIENAFRGYWSFLRYQTRRPEAGALQPRLGGVGG